jgi:hypothetical protein
MFKKTRFSFSPILFQNENIHILHPKSTYGILVFHYFDHFNVISQGLMPSSKYVLDYSKEQIFDEIFFRAPYKKNLGFSNNMNDYFSDNTIEKQKNLVIIRVCPYYTNVFSSEFRSYDNWGYWNGKQFINKTKKTMIKYMETVKENEKLLAEKKSNKLVEYNLITSQVSFGEKWRKDNNYSCLPIESNSEVLAKVDHIPPDWFVQCYWKGKKVIDNTDK